MEYKLTFKDYAKALTKGKLLGLRCKACNSITVPPRMSCQECGKSELDIVELGKKGRVETFTVVNVAPEGRQNEVPYIIALVKLDEGPWIMGNIIDINPAKATMDLIGKEVMVGFRVFPGDKYSPGDQPRPVFSFA
ncbi:MAG TPA: Zn-ribbon domain-containing OB-fold protein [Desulfatiglandales bacterium]|nr:Zn-ribbon domain-containing OB-fold protein [Desulfatiglandales bacterium]